MQIINQDLYFYGILIRKYIRNIRELMNNDIVHLCDNIYPNDIKQIHKYSLIFADYNHDENKYLSKNIIHYKSLTPKKSLTQKTLLRTNKMTNVIRDLFEVRGF